MCRQKVIISTYKIDMYTASTYAIYMSMKRNNFDMTSLYVDKKQ